MSFVIARSPNGATKQSSVGIRGPGLLRFARNDGSIQALNAAGQRDIFNPRAAYVVIGATIMR